MATQIRKINVALTARSKTAVAGKGRIFRNTLTSQVSLRSMSFGDDYPVE